MPSRCPRRRQRHDRLRAGRRWRDTGHVFASTIGTPLDGPNVTHGVPGGARASRAARQRFHDTRHAAATQLLEAGEDVGVVSRILGHSAVSLTLDTYGHPTDRMTEPSAARMGRDLRGRLAAFEGTAGVQARIERPTGGVQGVGS
jgi:integrase